MKKGFTLVELLAVIAILAILAIIITPTIIGVRNNVLKNTLDTKIKTINEAAADYAYTVMNTLKTPVVTAYDEKAHDYSDNSICRKIKVGTLIELNFLTVNSSHINGEVKENVILNPVTQESMNDLEVCMRFDNDNAMNRKIVTYIINQCDLYNKKADAKECLGCSGSVKQNSNGHWVCE